VTRGLTRRPLGARAVDREVQRHRIAADILRSGARHRPPDSRIALCTHTRVRGDGQGSIGLSPIRRGPYGYCVKLIAIVVSRVFFQIRKNETY
jgi:hypothetical protein